MQLSKNFAAEEFLVQACMCVKITVRIQYHGSGLVHVKGLPHVLLDPYMHIMSESVRSIFIFRLLKEDEPTICDKINDILKISCIPCKYHDHKDLKDYRPNRGIRSPTIVPEKSVGEPFG